MRRRTVSTDVAAHAARCPGIPEVREADAIQAHRAGLWQNRGQESGKLVGGEYADRVIAAVRATSPRCVAEELLQERSRSVQRSHPEHVHPSGNGSVDEVPWAQPLQRKGACQPANDPLILPAIPVSRGCPLP